MRRYCFLHWRKTLQFRLKVDKVEARLEKLFLKFSFQLWKNFVRNCEPKLTRQMFRLMLPETLSMLWPSKETKEKKTKQELDAKIISTKPGLEKSRVTGGKVVPVTNS